MAQAAPPQALWGVPFEDFMGFYTVGPMYWLDGRDEDHEHIYEYDPMPDVLWASADGAYTVQPLEDFEPPTVVLRAGGETVGFYMDGMLWVDEGHRGKGLAPEMVIAAATWLQAVPFKNDEPFGFTEDGLKAHLRAHQWAVERALAAGLPVPPEVRAEYGLEGDEAENEGAPQP